jgi:hypothetical protein
MLCLLEKTIYVSNIDLPEPKNPRMGWDCNFDRA